MEILLQRKELLDLGNKVRGMEIRCQAGCCWVTQTGDQRDLLLHAGGVFQVTRNGQLLISAMQDCRLTLHAKTQTSPQPLSWRQLCCS